MNTYRRILTTNISTEEMSNLEPRGEQNNSVAECCSLDISGAEQDRLLKMFKALSNPIRFEIMKYLVTHPCCITGDIVAYLPIAQATVSQHLKVLREAGWISGVTEGPAVNYSLNIDNITWFKTKIEEIF